MSIVWKEVHCSTVENDPSLWRDLGWTVIMERVAPSSEVAGFLSAESKIGLRKRLVQLRNDSRSQLGYTPIKGISFSFTRTMDCDSWTNN